MIATTTTTRTPRRAWMRTWGWTAGRVTGRIDVHTTADLRPRLHDVIDTASVPCCSTSVTRSSPTAPSGLLLEGVTGAERAATGDALDRADERCRLLRPVGDATAYRTRVVTLTAHRRGLHVAGNVASMPDAAPTSPPRPGATAPG